MAAAQTILCKLSMSLKLRTANSTSLLHDVSNRNLEMCLGFGITANKIVPDCTRNDEVNRSPLVVNLLVLLLLWERTLFFMAISVLTTKQPIFCNLPIPWRALNISETVNDLEKMISSRQILVVCLYSFLTMPKWFSLQLDYFLPVL